ncbi:MAG: hypothetical protein NTW87_08355 [Planctomycetota bacterium]|nr:hypothetical protein [Planctomycetota bacterium]
MAFCAEKNPRFTLGQITPAIVTEFEQWVHTRMTFRNGCENTLKRPMQPGQRKNVMEAASLLYRKAVASGWVSAARGNPFESLSQGRRRAPHHFPGFEACRIDQALLGDFLAACDPFQHRVFLLMLSCGLRTDEVRHMLIEKINWQRKFYILEPMLEQLGWSTKNGRYRLIPIFPQTDGLFRAFQGDPLRHGVLVRDFPELVESRPYLLLGPVSSADLEYAYQDDIQDFRKQHKRDPNPAEQERISENVFLAAGALHRKRIYMEFQKVVRKINADRHLWPHLTRHVTASQAHQHGVDRFVALSVLGHSSDSVFDRYWEKSPEFMHKEWAKVVGDNTVIADALARFNSQPSTAVLPAALQPRQIA